MRDNHRPPKELTSDQLRRVCDPALLGFDTTKDLCKSHEIIGQQRAQESLEFGVRIKQAGFNIFALGIPGTGKASKIHDFLRQEAVGKPVPSDWVYVQNFDDPNRPRAIALPPGRAKEMAKAVEDLIVELKKAIPHAFEDRAYLNKRKEIARRFEQKRNELLEAENQWAGGLGYGIVPGPEGVAMVPLLNGQPMGKEDFDKLSVEDKAKYGTAVEEFQLRMEVAMGKAREIEKHMREEIAQLDRKVAAGAVRHRIADLAKRFADAPAVADHLRAVQEDILENIGRIRREPTEEPEQGMNPMSQIIAKQAEDVFDTYGVNVIVDNGDLSGAPVVYEVSPTCSNLLGHIGQRMEMGALVSDFHQIRLGALHRANGGYLLLEAKDVLLSPLSWEALKRAVKNGQIRVEDAHEQFRLFVPSSIEPEPIPLNVKIILMGSPQLYYMLAAADEDFPKLFKVQADFDSAMPRDDGGAGRYAEFICTRVVEGGMLHFDASAVAQIVEFGSRLVEDQRKLSARFSDIADIVRESDYWARTMGDTMVSAKHVDKAIDHKVFRSNRVEERIREMIADGTVMIDTDGKVVGQVNGLSVLTLGDYMFGRPSRITASVAMGRGNVLDIEREANLAGPIHTKGVLILAGLLASRFGAGVPLSVAARIAMEQSYDGVEGDSASCAELHALLSAIGEIPLRQDIAVTGSVNQKGQVQAIGGATYKIEGFYDVCKVKGLTGTQGVMIPAANVPNLMLREDVVEAVAQGQFHVWAAETIEQGFEQLTGLPSGERDADGRYPADTSFALIDARLRAMAEEQRRFTAPPVA